ncbi:MAG: triose-phosphate isomerase [Leptospiraceae bacterium]|nr:triose-phosphate isomerase [Leptospiraceae bacterium]MCP5511523.1 triose-phosphate isomerase [Leptospiraceae bacterium]
MRRTIIAGNWKMNLNKAGVDTLVSGILNGLGALKSPPVIMVFPSTIHLSEVASAFKGKNVEVGCQNIYPSKLAAFTGETSIDQLKDLGIENVLLGHSERRQFLGETDEFLNQKVHHALSEKMKPMLCVGETLEEREANKTFDVVKRQVREGLKGVSKEDAKSITIAYEPVWAIGTGKVATPEQAEEVHAFIRKELAEVFSPELSEEISILYGGSVKPDNVKSLLEKPNIDGGLVGGASQKPDSFLGLLV